VAHGRGVVDHPEAPLLEGPDCGPCGAPGLPRRRRRQREEERRRSSRREG